MYLAMTVICCLWLFIMCPELYKSTGMRWPMDPWPRFAALACSMSSEPGLNTPERRRRDLNGRRKEGEGRNGEGRRESGKGLRSENLEGNGENGEAGRTERQKKSKGFSI